MEATRRSVGAMAAALAALSAFALDKVAVRTPADGEEIAEAAAFGAPSDTGYLIQRGGGVYSLPANRILDNATVRLVATTGTVAYELTEGVDAVEAPTEILNRAAMWFDASKAGSVLTTTTVSDDGTTTAHVENWLDVREDFAAAANGTYARPRAEASRHYFDRVPSLTECDARAAIYFGGYGSGRFMVWRRPDGSTNALNIAHAFIVAGMTTKKPAWIVGSVATGGWDTDEGGLWNAATRVSRWGTVRVDGRIYELHDHEKVLGFHLLEIDMGAWTSEPADCFFNCKNYQDDSPNGSDGGGKRGGGDYLSEVVVFTEPLTADERLKVEAYLLAKWRLDTMSGRALSIAANTSGAAQVVTTAATDDALEMLGDGVVVKTGTSDAYVVPSLNGGVAIASKPATPRGGQAAYGRSRINSFDGEGRTFAGRVRVGEGALYVNAPVALDVAGGMVVTAQRDRQGNKVTVTAGGASDRVVKRGDGSMVVDRLPGTVKHLETKEGTTVLKAPARAQNAHWANPNAGLKAAIPNADFETVSYAGDKKYVSILGTTYNGWTGYADQGAPVNTQAGISGRKDAAQGYDDYGTVYKLPAPHGGDGQLVLQYKASASASISVPADGYYDLTFWMACAGWVGTSADATMLAFDVQIVEPGDEPTTVGRAYALRLNADEAGKYRLVRMRTPYLTAGEKTFRFQNATYRETAVVIDDIEMTCLPDMPDARVVPVPNGDFEKYSGALYGYYDRAAAANNAAEGWTFEQPGDWNGVAAPRAPRAGLIFGNRACADFWLDGQRFGVNYGEASLALASTNGVARQAKIALKAGTYGLRGKVAARTMPHGCGYGSPWESWDGVSVRAAVKMSDGRVVELGNLNCRRQIPQKYVWPRSFTLEEDGDIELSLAGGNHRIAIVDDLEFVADQAVNLVKNGGFEQAAKVPAGSAALPADWSVQVGGGSSSVRLLTYGEWTDEHFMKGHFEGMRYVKLTGRASISQAVDIPAPGVYRLTMHEHTRLTNRDRPGVKVSLTDGLGVETTIGRIEPEADMAREFVREQYDVYVPAAGAYTLTLATLNDAGEDKSSLFDDIRLERVGRLNEAAAPSMDKTTVVSVDEGAKMRLEYSGALVVEKLVLGGRTYSGLVRAADAPEYLSGPGAIEVRPRSLVIVVR